LLTYELLAGRDGMEEMLARVPVLLRTPLQHAPPRNAISSIATTREALDREGFVSISVKGMQ
jgi:hypothetical protein